MAPHCTGYESSLFNCAQSVCHVENYNYAGVKCSPGMISINMAVIVSTQVLNMSTDKYVSIAVNAISLSLIFHAIVQMSLLACVHSNI